MANARPANMVRLEGAQVSSRAEILMHSASLRRERDPEEYFSLDPHGFFRFTSSALFCSWSSAALHSNAHIPRFLFLVLSQSLVAMAAVSEHPMTQGA